MITLAWRNACMLLLLSIMNHYCSFWYFDCYVAMFYLDSQMYIYCNSKPLAVTLEHCCTVSDYIHYMITVDVILLISCCINKILVWSLAAILICRHQVAWSFNNLTITHVMQISHVYCHIYRMQSQDATPRYWLCLNV